MNYTSKSFSVSVSMSQETWDRIFGKKTADAPAADAPAVEAPEAPAPAEAPVKAPGWEDLTERQCAACLDRHSLYWVAPGLIQCSSCLARFPQGVEAHMKVSADKACDNCGGTGKLRSNFVAFACAACSGTGAKGG